MTDAKSANWYSDGENAARRIDDLLPIDERPAAGDAADKTLLAGRDVFLPIFLAVAVGGSFFFPGSFTTFCRVTRNKCGGEVTGN